MSTKDLSLLTLKQLSNYPIKTYLENTRYVADELLTVTAFFSKQC